jgi:hypothetical protein
LNVLSFFDGFKKMSPIPHQRVKRPDLVRMGQSREMSWREEESRRGMRDEEVVVVWSEGKCGKREEGRSGIRVEKEAE